MYQIRCGEDILYDPRDDELMVLNPKCKLKENAVGEGSFTILPTHPNYNKLQKLKSVVEIRQDGKPIFRGRMTRDSRDFHNQFFVDLEGVLGFTNDTLIPPFNFPGDFPDASNASNMVEYFLRWILEQHNSRCEDWQKLKLGTVTVSDPNNYITRSSEKYASTWDTLKSKLFGSALGGYLYARCEEDGNYVDYVDRYTLTNTQKITFGENLRDITRESDAEETYSAILPIGKDGLTIANLPDGDLNDDLVKDGLYIYSKSGRESFGWVCVPVNESTWADVTEATNLQTKASSYLSGTAMKLSNTITIKAVDLHFTDEQIQSFRVFRNILVDSPIHGVTGESYRLSELNIDILNPQNTVITIGDTSRTLADINSDLESGVDEKIESTKNELKDYVSNTTKNLEQKIEGIDGTYFYIKYSQYEDGHVMTDVPNDSTEYMGTCSTNQETAPTDHTKYTWVKVKGKDGTNGSPGTPGTNGKTQYLHIKYSDDGKTFTGNLIPTDINDWESGWYRNGHETNDSRISHPDKIQVTPGEKYKYDVGNAQFKMGFTAYSGEDDSTYIVANQYNSNGVLTAGGTWNYIRAYIVPVDATGVNFETYQELFASGDIVPFVYPETSVGEELGAYIGTLVDFTETDSTNFDDYTWKKFTEDVDDELENIRQTILEQNTSVLNTAEAIILEALERYVETSNYEEFRQTVESELKIMADQISMNFTSTVERIENVNGDLQSTNEELEKHFEFTVDGLVIKAGENSMNLLLDNDLIRFMRNGEQFGWWDGVDFHTGNIVVKVNERAQFGNFAFVPRSNGSLSFLKVSGGEFTKKLLGISSTYTGDSVPVGTSLDELTGITVTATYSDNTTKEVSDYSISGVINEGENIITVTYSGKTSRFVVVGEPVNTEPDFVLGSGSAVTVCAWAQSTSTGLTVYYADSVEVIDGVVSLKNQKGSTFYQTQTGKTNNYDVLLGKYVKGFSGGIFYIDPNAVHTHSTGGTFTKEGIMYNPGYPVNPTE
jgi:hypothetical protein